MRGSFNTTITISSESSRNFRGVSIQAGLVRDREAAAHERGHTLIQANAVPSTDGESGPERQRSRMRASMMMSPAPPKGNCLVQRRTARLNVRRASSKGYRTKPGGIRRSLLRNQRLAPLTQRRQTIVSQLPHHFRRR